MKNLILMLIAATALFGCTDKKTGQKTTLDDVIKVHDKVMNADEQLMADKMRLDTLLKQGDLALKDTAKLLSAKLAAVDSAMEVWMHNFKEDFKGKTDEETTAYMDSQKKLIMAVDSQINAAITESDKYLKKIKIK